MGLRGAAFSRLAMALAVTIADPLPRAGLWFQGCADRMNDGMERAARAPWDRMSPTAKLRRPGEYRKRVVSGLKGKSRVGDGDR